MERVNTDSQVDRLTQDHEQPEQVRRDLGRYGLEGEALFTLAKTEDGQSYWQRDNGDRVNDPDRFDLPSVGIVDLVEELRQYDQDLTQVMENEEIAEQTLGNIAENWKAVMYGGDHAVLAAVAQSTQADLLSVRDRATIDKFKFISDTETVLDKLGGAVVDDKQIEASVAHSVGSIKADIESIRGNSEIISTYIETLVHLLDNISNQQNVEYNSGQVVQILDMIISEPQLGQATQLKAIKAEFEQLARVAA